MSISGTMNEHFHGYTHDLDVTRDCETKFGDVVAIIYKTMADSETVTLDPPHPPHAAALEAFTFAEQAIKHAIKRSRHDWDKHEPRMWSRAASLSDAELVAFDVNSDIVEVRSGPTAYGQVIFGKIKIPAIQDEKGEGFVHVRIHHTPGEPEEKVKFHSIRTEESIWSAILPDEYPLEFFNE